MAAKTTKEILADHEEAISAIGSMMADLVIQVGELANVQLEIARKLSGTPETSSQPESPPPPDWDAEIENESARLKAAEKVMVFHDGEEPRGVRCNGVRYVLYPGENVVPKPVADIYYHALRDAEEGERQRALLEGTNHLATSLPTYPKR